MRNVVFITRPGCAQCLDLLETVIAPLKERHPRNVEVHSTWDGKIAEINKRGTITRIPLFVVENGGREEFRYSGRLSLEELEAIVTCEDEVLTLDDVMEGF